MCASYLGTWELLVNEMDSLPKGKREIEYLLMNKLRAAGVHYQV